MIYPNNLLFLTKNTCVCAQKAVNLHIEKDMSNNIIKPTDHECN